jgi:mRNA interferase HigB
VRVISKKALREFWEQHADAEVPLRAWYAATTKATWSNLAEVRQTINSADVVGNLTIFNIGGNKYRLIVAIHYDRQMIFIRHVLTHAEYNRGRWKE